MPALAQLWHQFQTTHRATLEAYYLNPLDINTLFRDFILGLLEKYRREQGKDRIAEKSPDNVYFFSHLKVMFPDSPLIHVIRDGRDVVCSLLTMDWSNVVTGQPMEYTRDAGKAAAYWVGAVQAGRKLQGAEETSDRYMEIRYEEIVSEPEPALRKLFDFIGEPWHPEVLNYHQQKRDLAGESSADQVSRSIYTSAIGRWRRDLRPEDKKAVKEAAGDMLVELGYADGHDW